MNGSDPAFFRELATLLERGEACATAQIVRVNGSIPNAVGARLLVSAGGKLEAGTVGGGMIEHRTLEAAREALAEGTSRMFSAKLTEAEAGGIGMMCGGQVDVFIEVLRPEPALVLCGAGHINLALARMARGLGFRVLVIDDRPDWANAHNYPDAKVIVDRPEQVLGTLGLDSRSFVIVGTRDRDTEVIVAASHTPARYIGVVASKRKAIQIVKHLADRPGVDLAALLPRLHAPIGLALGGRSPEAVALSILAEVQAVRNEADASAMRVAPEELACFAAKKSSPS
ncbi:MAG: XdhC/CoxI family protein [Myxococcota bacterium]